MIQPLLNIFRLIRIVRERGNRPLIRRSPKQLRDFILCRNDLNRENLLSLPFYWWRMFKGLDMLVWRLETFGFLHLPQTTEEERARLNEYLDS
ncbi:MAG: hypothetical protein O6704_07215 [Nitrospinae bacterium]|nr:hypothetical protein [Nitrospinota bacterium]